MRNCMDYLISPFGFPPVGQDLQQEIDIQISSTNNYSAYVDVFSLLQTVCEKNLWSFSFTDTNKALQSRLFSTSRFFFLSGYQIRGLAELHLALKFHLDTSIKLEDSRTGYSGIYFFDVLDRINSFEPGIIVSQSEKPLLVATWKKVELNADLAKKVDDKEYTHASYPLHYVRVNKSLGLKTTSYEDFIYLFKELRIIDPKNKKYVLSFFEDYIFKYNKTLRIDYTGKRLTNAKILVLNILGRFLHIESNIVGEYLEQKNYSWNNEAADSYSMFFSVVLNAVFGLIDNLIVTRELAVAKALNTDNVSEYSQLQSIYNYSFDDCEHSDHVDHINELNYQPDFDEALVDDLHDAETDRDYVPTFELADYDDHKTIEFIQAEPPIPDLFITPPQATSNKSLLLDFTIDQSRKGLVEASNLKEPDSNKFGGIDFGDIGDFEERPAHAVGIEKSSGADSVPSFDFNAIEFSQTRITPETPKRSEKQKIIAELQTEEELIAAVLESPYDPAMFERIEKSKANVDLLLNKKITETKTKQFDGNLDFRSTEKFITIDTSVKHEDIVKKVTESRELLTVEEKKQAVIAMHDVVKVKHPFMPRLNDVAAWTILTKKWLHLLSYAETKEIVNTALANRATYFDLMCLKQNVLRSWNELESGYLQHQYLKNIAFDVFNTIYETWEYRQYIDDMASTIINDAVSITKVKYALNLTTRETIEWSKLTDQQFADNIFIESYQYKYDIVLPEMREDKISELKTAFSQLYDNVDSNYKKIFGKYPGASHIFRLSAILFDLLLLNIQACAEYKLEMQDDIFAILSEFKADFHDARKLDGLTEDKFYVQSILTDIEPFVRRRVSPEELFKF